MNDDQRRQLREEGFCVFPEALPPAMLKAARDALARGLQDTRERAAAAGGAHDGRLDPNAANERVYNLPALDPVFLELLRFPAALAATRELLGDNVLVSNFSANIAYPGSGSMRLHSDQALVIPAPWHAPWAANIIWCLDDVDEENGATRYLPGSHRFRTAEEVPPDALAQTRAFAAPAGSFVLMEGRLWHTSGPNVSKDRQRRMMFAYYACDFIRQQANWNVALPAAVQEAMDDDLRALFGLGPAGNVRIGGSLTRLNAG